MVKINRIYTRTGDDGSTSLVGGSRIPKASLRVNAYGDIDELNSWLGFTVTTLETSVLKPIAEMLLIVQNELFDIGSELASLPGSDISNLPVVAAGQIAQLENWIDQSIADLPELRSFILPGGSQSTSALHVARTIARRAERSVLALHHEEPVRDIVIIYLNRLSDLLFALARRSGHALHVPEILWIPAATRAKP